MNRPLTTACAAVLGLALLAATACDDDPDAVRGSGTLATEDRSVADFDTIALEGSGDVVIDVGGIESLTIEAEDNLLPLLTSDVRGSTLVLSSSESISPTEPITYAVGATSLDGVSVTGSGDVTAPNVSCTAFDVSVTGMGTIDLGGACEQLAVSITGSGDVDTVDLTVASAAVRIDGSGDVVVNATDDLQVTINGSGDVTYVGDPATDIDINGSGDVSRL